MSDESQESLAAQMGAWVPPWERKRDEPDRDFQDEAVDAPQELPGEAEPEPTEVELDPEPEVPLPDSVEEAAEQAAEPAPDAAEPEFAPVDEPVAAPAPVDEFVAGPEPVDEFVAGPAPADEPARSDVELTGYLAGFEDASAHLAGDPVVDVTPVPVAVPVQPSGPREEAADGRTEERVVDDAELSAALEAILLVVDEPTNELKLAEVLEQPVERVARMLDDISARYTAAGHGFDLRRAAGGWRLYTRPEYAAYVERFVLDGQSVRLTQAALETLAVVAYKQPVTRSRISAIRGVNCDGVMRTLVTRGLIEEVGTEPETGAYLYRTTALFLEKLGLNSVDQLPPLAPFLPDDVEEVLDASG
ncbi:SMC-Scp complex subunit ScpB [Actinoplanes sp. NPDC020271]|uniref:SMC-Scp complex subunit ScpB n=1 Tax=Actinoplanes sp. NPDC020271 TaxID=3363896 RepID=UPI00378A1993